MSRRRTSDATETKQGEHFLQALPATVQSATTGLLGDAGASRISAASGYSPEFDKLSPVEKSVAILGVDIKPEEWKPISFMNNKHYEALMASNLLDDTLTRRIEAYRQMATAEDSKP